MISGRQLEPRVIELRVQGVEGRWQSCAQSAVKAAMRDWIAREEEGR